MTDLPPNHHADYKQFDGLFGYVGALSMISGRGGDARLIAELAKPGPDDHVVDIGCGPGTAVRTLAGSANHVIGVDPSAPMLQAARVLSRLRPTSGQVEWVEAGAEDLPVPDDSVTICVSLKSVHHWPHLDEGIAEVARVLRPGGRFLTLEKRTTPGATGNASHGWTDDQAHTFAAMLTDAGFTSAEVTNHDRGKSHVVVVTAER